jgi:hypothetical protein
MDADVDMLVLPGAAAAAAAALPAGWALPGALYGNGAGSPHASDSSSSSRCSSSSRSGLSAQLPAGIGRLSKLRRLVLEHLVPDYGVLSRLKQLERLELRVGL